MNKKTNSEEVTEGKDASGVQEESQSNISCNFSCSDTYKDDATDYEGGRCYSLYYHFWPWNAVVLIK